MWIIDGAEGFFQYGETQSPLRHVIPSNCLEVVASATSANEVVQHRDVYFQTIGYHSPELLMLILSHHAVRHREAAVAVGAEFLFGLSRLTAFLPLFKPARHTNIFVGLGEYRYGNRIWLAAIFTKDLPSGFNRRCQLIQKIMDGCNDRLYVPIPVDR